MLFILSNIAWSHPAMTSLTNQQIVAELKWTEKAIQSVIGVTPIYWRPPCKVLISGRFGI